MVKSISSGLKAHLASPVTSVCTCWRIQRRDGQLYCFTDHDQDLVVSGDTYVAAVGYSRTALQAQGDLQVDNIDMQGIFDDASITADDMRSGLWDHADVWVFMVNWADLTQGIMRLRRGTLGDVASTASGVFKTQLNGLMQLLQNTIGELYSPGCRADLGDSRCQVDLVGGGWQKTGTITSIGADNQTFIVAVDESRAVDGWFLDGVVTFTSGENDGRSMEVKGWVQSTATVHLFLPMPRPIAVGDTFTIYPGCAKTVEMCRDRYNNIVNMRAEPYVPGQDALLQSAATVQ